MRLSAVVRIERHPTGPRLYGFNLRIHHGTVGVIAIVSYPIHRRRSVVAAGVTALVHDLPDFPFTDNHNH